MQLLQNTPRAYDTANYSFHHFNILISSFSKIHYLVVITKITAKTRIPFVRHVAKKNRISLRDFISEAFFQKYGRTIAHKTATYTYNELDIELHLLLFLYPHSKVFYSKNIFYPTKADRNPIWKTHSSSQANSVVSKFSMRIEFIDARPRTLIYKICVYKN